MDDTASAFRVQSAPGYDEEPTPVRLFFGQRQVEVIDELDRWLDPDHSYFKILGSDGAVYIVRFDVPSGQWDLTLYDSGLS